MFTGRLPNRHLLWPLVLPLPKPFRIAASSNMPLSELDPQLPLPENILRHALSDPKRMLGFIVDEFSTRASLKSVTWREALSDVRQRARELVETTGHPAQKLGENKFPVGLLLKNGYGYFITLTVAVMLRWTVCVYLCIVSVSRVTH